MLRLLSTLLFLITGFALGYAYHARQEQNTSRGDPANVPTTSIRATNLNSQSKSVPLRRSSDHIKMPRTQDTLAKKQNAGTQSNTFSTYIEHLDAQRYIDAMQLYYEAVSSTPFELNRYKKEITKRLKGYLSGSGNETQFMDLSDAFLSQYYADTDILLYVAEFNRKQLYLSEAAQNYEFAYLYAHNDDSRIQVRSEFVSFVNAIDAVFSEQEDWFRLLDFYQNIILLDLHTQYHRLRYGKLLVLTDNVHEAISLFTELSDDRLVGRDARLALNALEENEPQSPVRSPSQQWEGSIAMTRHGQHYLVNLELNKRQQMSLLLDTGASITSISRYAFEQLREKHRFDFLGTRLFSTANGIAKGWVYRADEVRLGQFRLKDIELVAMSLPPNEHYDGLLGMNVLRNFRFQIDQDTAELKLSKRKRR